MLTSLSIGAVIALLLLIWLASVAFSNRRDERRYGKGEHQIIINHPRGEPDVFTSGDSGAIHGWRNDALKRRSTRSVEIIYANGWREFTRNHAGE